MNREGKGILRENKEEKGLFIILYPYPPSDKASYIYIYIYPITTPIYSNIYVYIYSITTLV